MPTKRLNGSEMVIEALRLEGVKVIFGYPGGAVLNVYDEIYKQNHFQHILTRHEQGAIHAADGYARASGEVGVAIITSGPGFTNAVTGIATAYTDSIPLVIISGQVPIAQIGTDAFQEIDAVGISRPCTKHNFLVKSIDELPRILKEAFYIAKSGRPGPVLVDLPKDISATFGEFDYPSEVLLRTYKPTTKGNSRQIKKVVQALKEAKKPLFYIGGGAVISGASEAIRELVDKTQIPVLETLMARGVIPEGHPRLLGMVGMHGTYAANMAMQECDLLLCLGARFDDRVTGKVSEFAKYAKIVHIDIDPSSIGKIIDVHFPIVGDLKSVCEDILECLQDYDVSAIKTWQEHLDKYAHTHPLRYQDSDEVLKPQWVIQKIGEILGERAIIVTDVGQHQMWAAQFYPFSFPRQLITSGGLGTMGFGLPASMGVQKAKNDKIIVNITGDGSILMNIQELMTCVEEKIPVINVILNNNYLGMVRQWQSFFYEHRFSHTDLSLQPDFVKLIEAFGGRGFRVENKKDFEEAFKEAIKLGDSGVVCMLDVIIDRMEHVLPMVPGGAPLNKMILE
ncbi:acetolactate synthase large subunit [Helicobacter sp. 11S02596-1]|uniref:acetolactate synthase large subunit n=1 Tax=Helicobacter sp. 11S02596-1 TaxID=1476194 RepID=UPI000BA56022|nr:acetolactate synthase large subunit [Helicobacter sp. 11S02596-1]PAF44768.1 acetolactate synthase, large subunit, biosynthetic type [Helicobacter sp. 11S02596-1]